MGERQPDGTDSWAKVASLLPLKTLQQVIEYSRLFEFYLARAEPKTRMLPGEVPLQTVFMDKQPGEVASDLLAYCYESLQGCCLKE